MLAGPGIIIFNDSVFNVSNGQHPGTARLGRLEMVQGTGWRAPSFFGLEVRRLSHQKLHGPAGEVSQGCCSCKHWTHCLQASCSSIMWGSCFHPCYHELYTHQAHLGKKPRERASSREPRASSCLGSRKPASMHILTDWLCTSCTNAAALKDAARLLAGLAQQARLSSAHAAELRELLQPLHVSCCSSSLRCCGRLQLQPAEATEHVVSAS